MGVFIDLTGQNFGKLVAIKPIDKRKNGKIVWECRCECGNICNVSRSDMVSGKTKSCGCLHKESSTKLGRSNAKDLTNKQFERLTVLRRSKYKRVMGKREVGWLCKCSCGNFAIVKSTNLIRGNTKSCGCLNREQITTHGLSKTKEYVAMKTRKRNERKKVHDSEWTFEMELALKQFQSACVICGSTERLSVDHVLPLSKGYGLKPGNAVTLCMKCNSRKNGRLINDLPIETQVNLIWNAFKFKDYWQHKNKLY
jgi:5-methylcytosine-specific restriction endonuclease McrA